MEVNETLKQHESVGDGWRRPRNSDERSANSIETHRPVASVAQWQSIRVQSESCRFKSCLIPYVG